MKERREAKEQLKSEARQRRAEQMANSGTKLPADSTEDNQDGTKKVLGQNTLQMVS